MFVGHGRSNEGLKLRVFSAERLCCPVDESNRVHVADCSTSERLQAMLDVAAFAFLVLTAEDEPKDGQVAARQNVVHEVGLFQGRLGLRRAIALLENGCEQFSNIQGLSQIRFPPENITAVEEVRATLEREGLLVAVTPCRPGDSSDASPSGLHAHCGSHLRTQEVERLMLAHPVKHRLRHVGLPEHRVNEEPVR